MYKYVLQLHYKDLREVDKVKIQTGGKKWTIKTLAIMTT
jgi:hypothetical protein